MEVRKVGGVCRCETAKVSVEVIGYGRGGEEIRKKGIKRWP